VDDKGLRRQSLFDRVGIFVGTARTMVPGCQQPTSLVVQCQHRRAATPGAMVEVPMGRKRSTAFGALAEFCAREQCEWE